MAQERELERLLPQQHGEPHRKHHSDVLLPQQHHPSPRAALESLLKRLARRPKVVAIRIIDNEHYPLAEIGEQGSDLAVVSPRKELHVPRGVFHLQRSENMACISFAHLSHCIVFYLKGGEMLSLMFALPKGEKIYINPQRRTFHNERERKSIIKFVHSGGAWSICI